MDISISRCPQCGHRKFECDCGETIMAGHIRMKIEIEAELFNDIKQLVQVVKEMRAAQRQYFKERRPIDIQNARRLEAACDSRLASLIRMGL